MTATSSRKMGSRRYRGRMPAGTIWYTVSMMHTSYAGR